MLVHVIGQKFDCPWKEIDVRVDYNMIFRSVFDGFPDRNVVGSPITDVGVMDIADFRGYFFQRAKGIVG